MSAHTDAEKPIFGRLAEPSRLTASEGKDFTVSKLKVLETGQGPSHSLSM